MPRPSLQSPETAGRSHKCKQPQVLSAATAHRSHHNNSHTLQCCIKSRQKQFVSHTSDSESCSQLDTIPGPVPCCLTSHPPHRYCPRYHCHCSSRVDPPSIQQCISNPSGGESPLVTLPLPAGQPTWPMSIVNFLGTLVEPLTNKLLEVELSLT